MISEGRLRKEKSGRKVRYFYIPEDTEAVRIKQEMLAFLRAVDWDMPLFRTEGKKYVTDRRINISSMIKQFGLTEELKDKFNEIYIKEFGNIEAAARFFHLKRDTLLNMLNDLEIPLPEIDVKAIANKSREELLDILEKLNWDLKIFSEQLIGTRPQRDYGYAQFFEDIGIKDDIIKKIKQVYSRTNGSPVNMGKYFNISPKTIQNIIDEYGIEFTDTDLPAVVGVSKEGLLELLDHHNWDISLVFKTYILSKLDDGHITFIEVIREYGIVDDFRSKLFEEYAAFNRSVHKTAVALGLAPRTLRMIMTDFNIDIDQAESGYGWLLREVGMSQEEALQFIEDRNWNLSEVVSDLHNRLPQKNTSYPDIISGLNLEDAFKEKFRKICTQMDGAKRAIGSLFGVDLRSITILTSKFGLSFDERIETSGGLLDVFGMTKDEVLAFIVKNDWSIEKLYSLFRDKLPRGNMSYGSLITGVGIEPEFKEELVSTYALREGKIKRSTLR